MRHAGFWLVVALVATACSSDAAVETPTTATLAESTTTEAPTTSTTPALAPPDAIELDPLPNVGEGAPPIRLSDGVTYAAEIEGIVVRFTPPAVGWEVFEYNPSGGRANLVLDWSGPSGFQDETLNIEIFDFDLDVGSAWSRIDKLLAEGEARHGKSWTEVEAGSAMVGGRAAEWREVRTPPLPPNKTPGLEGWYGAQDYLHDPNVWGDTSVRFFVVLLEEATISLAAYETRCACGASRSQPGDGAQASDEVENELSMWLPELEAFLSTIEFVES